MQGSRGSKCHYPFNRVLLGDTFGENIICRRHSPVCAPYHNKYQMNNSLWWQHSRRHRGDLAILNPAWSASDLRSCKAFDSSNLHYIIAVNAAQLSRISSTQEEARFRSLPTAATQGVGEDPFENSKPTTEVPDHSS